MLLPLLLALAPVAPLAQDGSGAEALERRPARLVTEPLESPAGSPARLSSVVRGADGRVVLTWIEEDDEGAAALRLARLGNDGWSEPSTVVRAPDLFLNWADFPAAQASADGTLLVAWLRRGEGPGLAYGVEYAVSTDGGAGWTEPVRLHNDASPVEHGFVSLAPCGPSAFLAVWLDGREMAAGAHDGDASGHGHGHGGPMTLRARLVDRDGRLGRELLLDERVCDCCQTSVAPLGGAWIAAYRDRSDAEVRDVAFVRFDPSTAGRPRPLHEDGWRIEGCPVNGPQLAPLTDGVAAAWYTGAGEGAGRVQVAFLGAREVDFSDPVVVDEGAPVGRVAVAPLEDGSVLVGWLEHLDLERGSAWRLRRVTRAGERGEPITLATVPGERASGFLRLAASEDGAIATWTDAGPSVRTARVRLVR
jgi:hypothetical protein